MDILQKNQDKQNVFPEMLLVSGGGGWVAGCGVVVAEKVFKDVYSTGKYKTPTHIANWTFKLTILFKGIFNQRLLNRALYLFF